MGFYLRKSFKAGPFRFNLSKSGIGTSFGVKGLRYGINSKGQEYIHAGRYGAYYRQNISYNSKKENNFIQFEETEMPDELKQLYHKNARVITIIIFSPLLLIFIIAGLGTIFEGSFGAGLFMLALGIVPIWGFLFSAKVNTCDDATNGYKAYKNGNYIESTEKFKSILEQKSSSISQASKNWLINMVFLSYIKLTEYEKALEFVKDNPNQGQREKIVACLYYLEHWEHLINHIQQNYTLEEKTELPIIYAMLGNAFLKLGQNEIALETLLQGPIRKRSMDIMMCAFRYTLAQCYEANNRPKEALKQYQKICTFDVNYEDVKNKIEELSK